MSPPSSDRIEKQIVLEAPIARVWRAVADRKEFGTWFQVDIVGEFVPGARLSGHMTYPGYEHVLWDVTVERVEPPHVIAWRWHPSAIEPGVDYSAEPTTLVEFTLAEVEGGTLLTVVESGFDRLPPARRAAAFSGNERGWTGQMRNIERHVANSP